MIEIFKDVVTNKYAQFEGRARRAEYWYFYLVYILLAIAANIVDAIVGFPALGIILALGLLVPNLAVAVRRLHDTGKSGWWLLILFLPILGAIAILVFLCTEGDSGSNEFGPDPKAVGVDDITEHLI